MVLPHSHKAPYCPDNVSWTLIVNFVNVHIHVQHPRFGLKAT